MYVECMSVPHLILLTSNASMDGLRHSSVFVLGCTIDVGVRLTPSAYLLLAQSQPASMSHGQPLPP